MVQKKIPQKTISLQQPDHVVVKVKSKNLSQPQQQQDVNKNIKGPDLKKMKKSGSIKRQELGKPNYMKPTSSSDARKGLQQVMSFKKIISSSVIRRKKVAFCNNIDSQRSTCSSTLKDTKFPAYLSLNPGATESQGTSVIKVCPYTYCSLNGHHHAPSPPLKCFLSARRRVIKSQGRTVNPVVTDDDFFVEIYRDGDKGEYVDDHKVENVQFDEQVSDMEWETQGTDVKSDIYGGDELIDDDEFVKIETGKKENGCVDEFFPSDQESFDDEERFNSDWFSISDDDGDSTNCLEPNELPGEENQENSGVADQLKKAKTETEDSAQLVLAITKRNKPVDEDTDDSGTFNPRAPNFLPLEPDPDAEKVDLKHQDLDERKNSEEWMVDYTLRQVVTKLGSARKRKVALLVEAFEKVTPVKKCEVQLRDASGFDQARPMQACS